MYPVIRLKLKTDKDNYAVEIGNNVFHFQFDERTQMSRDIHTTGYIQNKLDRDQIKNIWEAEEDVVLSYINFERYIYFNSEQS